MTASTTGPRTRAALGALAGVGVAVLSILVLVLLVRTWSLADAIRESQVTNTKTVRNTATIAEDTKATLDLVQGCVTVGESCYQQGQSQTAAAVGSINDFAIWAAACADQPGTQAVEEIEHCIIEQSKKASSK